jgi:hypothetical protein
VDRISRRKRNHLAAGTRCNQVNCMPMTASRSPALEGMVTPGRLTRRGIATDELEFGRGSRNRATSVTGGHPTVGSLIEAGNTPESSGMDQRSADREGPRVWLAGTRPALIVFAVGEAAAFVFYLWVGRGSWFIADEWDFLSDRSAGNLHDLFATHSQHWSTLPILAYRFWWQVIGVRSYAPYLASVITLHLTVAALLRAVMRRSGVSSWVATVAALVFALFGSGYFDIIYGFQIGFCGSLVFGLLYLLATDHDGPWDRRDLFGLLAGLASLMCSGVGVTMVVVVAVAVAIRRGWRIALAHALPMAAVYLVWFASIGHEGYPPSASLFQALSFARMAIASTFAALGHAPLVGGVLAVVLVGGGVVAWDHATRRQRRVQLAAPLALLLGAVVFALVTGLGRGASPSGNAGASASRYLHIIAALSIPALAVASDAVIRRWRVAAPVMLVALLVGVPGNLVVAVRHGDANRATAAFYRPYILTLPRLPVARVLPTGIHPDIYFDPVMTLGWLRAGVASGRIPPPPPTVTASERATWTLGMALQSTTQKAPSCTVDALPTMVTVHVGDTLTVGGLSASVTLVESPHVQSAPRVLNGYVPGATFLAYQDMVLQVTPSRGTSSITVCSHAAP